MEAEFMRCPVRPRSARVRQAVPAGLALASLGGVGLLLQGLVGGLGAGAQPAMQMVAATCLLIGLVVLAVGFLSAFGTLHLELCHGTTGLYFGKLDEQHPWVHKTMALTHYPAADEYRQRVLRERGWLRGVDYVMMKEIVRVQDALEQALPTRASPSGCSCCPHRSNRRRSSSRASSHHAPSRSTSRRERLACSARNSPQRAESSTSKRAPPGSAAIRSPISAAARLRPATSSRAIARTQAAHLRSSRRARAVHGDAGRSTRVDRGKPADARVVHRPTSKEGAGSRARKRYHNAECGHMNNALRWGKPAGAWALGLLAVRIARIGAPSNIGGTIGASRGQSRTKRPARRRRPITAHRRVPKCHFVLPISADADC